jgi:neurotransmitter:Na+ symporter, NSS family
VTFFGLTVFGIMDFTSSNILLPLGGLLIVVFVGWFLGSSNVRDEVSNSGTLPARLYSVFMFLLKFIAPVAIAIVFLHSIGLIK